ncbi:hypothetical protein DL95DRAFT_384245 [Leptodontidium sp. 2 PMI_412]|nr:hypothetical protein DL95DRAFT_384245 [Leptodontidium sp. 2 PMI_412]
MEIKFWCAFLAAFHLFYIPFSMTLRFFLDSYRVTWDAILFTLAIMELITIFIVPWIWVMEILFHREEMGRYESETIEPCDRSLSILESDCRRTLWMWTRPNLTPDQLAFCHENAMPDMDGYDREVEDFRDYLLWRKIDGRRIFETNLDEKDMKYKELAESNGRLLLWVLGHRGNILPVWAKHVENLPEGKERFDSIKELCLQCLRHEDDIKTVCLEGWSRGISPGLSLESEKQWLLKNCLERVRGAVSYMEHLREKSARYGKRHTFTIFGYEVGCALIKSAGVVRMDTSDLEAGKEC